MHFCLDIVCIVWSFCEFPQDFSRRHCEVHVVYLKARVAYWWFHSKSLYVNSQSAVRELGMCRITLNIIFSSKQKKRWSKTRFAKLFEFKLVFTSFSWYLRKILNTHPNKYKLLYTIKERMIWMHVALHVIFTSFFTYLSPHNLRTLYLPCL